MDPFPRILNNPGPDELYRSRKEPAMSTRTVIIALAAALLLAVATIAVVVSQSTPPHGASDSSIQPGQRLLEITPSQITRIEIIGDAAEPSRAVILQRTDNPADPWIITLGPDSPRWPLEAARVDAFLRVLAEETAVAPVPSDQPVELADALLLRLLTQDQKTLQLAISPKPIAGRVNVRTPDGSGEPTRAAVARVELLDLLRSPGPTGWRATNLIERALDQADAFTLETLDQQPPRRISFSSSPAGWMLREPFASPTEPGTVDRLREMLSQTTVERFLDTAPESFTPVSRLILDDPDSVILFGSPGPDASITAQLPGDRYVVLDAAPLATPDLMNPYTYIRRAPIATPAVSVARIEILPATDTPSLVLARSAGTWQPVSGETPSPQTDARLLLEFLTNTPVGDSGAAFTPADVAVFSVEAPPEVASGTGTINLASPGGSPLESISVAAITDKQRTQIAVGTVNVWRIYPADLAPHLLKVAAGLDTPTAGTKPLDQTLEQDPVLMPEK